MNICSQLEGWPYLCLLLWFGSLLPQYPSLDRICVDILICDQYVYIHDWLINVRPIRRARERRPDDSNRQMPNCDSNYRSYVDVGALSDNPMRLLCGETQEEDDRESGKMRYMNWAWKIRTEVTGYSMVSRRIVQLQIYDGYLDKHINTTLIGHPTIWSIKATTEKCEKQTA